MAVAGSRIGQSTVIRGSIRGAGDIDLHGRVEGTIEIDGDVTVGDSARLKAPVNGGRVVVRGAIAGNIRGKESVVLEEGARVVGDLTAPSIGIRAGGLLRGHVASGDHAESRAAEGRAHSHADRAHAPATRGRAAATQRNSPIAAPPPRPQPAASVSHATSEKATEKKAEAPAASVSSPRMLEPIASPLTKPARQAPAPVMPALQKGAKAALKKKAR